MHTGVISFCDRIAYNIKSSDTKDEILQELETRFQIRILQRHWQTIDPENVHTIYRSPHMACLRSNGNPYYMYFTRYEDTPIIYYIDKKVQPGYQKPRIILGRGFFDACVFNNTLLEGEMVKDKTGKWIFLINDVIAFDNQFLDDVPFPKRLEHAYTIFGKYHKPDTYADMCAFHVKQFVYATREGLDHLLSLNEELPYTHRGIYYWPFYLRYKPRLMNFDPSLIREVHRKVKDNPEFREGNASAGPTTSATTASAVTAPTPYISPIAPTPTTPEDSERVLWLRKTEQPDVYEVLEKDHLQSNKMGMAHVASLVTSKLLRSVFKEATVAVLVPFHCKYNDTFKKWLPIAVAAAAT